MKNINKIFSIALFLVASFAASAQSASISTTVGDRTVTATAVSPYIIRVDNVPAGTAPASEQSVLRLEPYADAKVISRSNLITPAGVCAQFDTDGVLVLASPVKGSTLADTGNRGKVNGKNAISLALSGKGSFYGAGERGHRLNLSGDTLVMYNRQNYGYTGSDPRIKQMNITMPVVLSSDGYALVFDDFAASELILSNPLKYVTESAAPVTYYYIAGTRNLEELTEAVSELTGRQPLPPLWSLGYITSKYGYRTQAETEGVVDTLKQRGYPLDGIVLDLYWYGKEQDMGRLAWDPEQWPEPKDMLARLKDRGVNLVAISQPYLLRNGRGVDNYNELSSKGMLVKDSVGNAREVKIWVGEGGMFDVSNPDTRRWLANRYGELTDMGVAGWWGDLGEPEVHPDSAYHANGLTTRLYHNKYGNDWSEIISELFATKYPDRRLMTLMRGGTTGLQRHSVFPWSTDVSRSWGGLEPQVRIMLNSGLSGLGYMSSDLGGFAVDPDNAYMPELYVRWLQLGLFSPVFRTHAQQFAEPYNYPQYEDIIKKLVLERYRWLPYNYSLAFENARFGYPLVRPLDFHDNAHGLYDAISDQYLWGRDVMVAPVMTEGAEIREILFPEGAEWVDMSDPSHIYAGGTIEGSYVAPLDKIPLFVRRGAFIPTADYAMDNTGDYRSDAFTVNYYPLEKGESTFDLYDDNRTDKIEAGNFRTVSFKGTSEGKNIEIEVSASGAYSGAPAAIDFNFKVYTLVNKPKAVKVNGKNVKFTFENDVLSFKAAFEPEKTLTVKIDK